MWRLTKFFFFHNILYCFNNTLCLLWRIESPWSDREWRCRCSVDRWVGRVFRRPINQCNLCTTFLKSTLVEVRIAQTRRNTTYTFRVEYLYELVQSDGVISAKAERHALQLFGKVYLNFVSIQKITSY